MTSTVHRAAVGLFVLLACGLECIVPASSAQESDSPRRNSDGITEERLRRFRPDEIYIDGLILGADFRTGVVQIEQDEKSGPMMFAEEALAEHRIVAVRLAGAQGIAFVDGEKMTLRDAWEHFDPGHYIRIAKYPDRKSTSTFAAGSAPIQGTPWTPTIPTVQPPGRPRGTGPLVKYTASTAILSISGEIRVSVDQ